MLLARWAYMRQAQAVPVWLFPLTVDSFVETMQPRGRKERRILVEDLLV